MTEHVHGIFRFVDPPDAAALQQCVNAIDACFYPWERCLPELSSESGGLVTVVWEDTGQGNTGFYVGGRSNTIKLNNRYSGQAYGFTMLHEAGHMVDDTALRDDQRQAILARWHADLDGRWDGYIQNGEESVWSHNEPHTHSEWSGGWSASMVDSGGYNGYYHRPNEAFADTFVAAFAPTVFPYVRFAHWSDNLAALRSIILSDPAPPPPPKVWPFPNDTTYRLYRATFLREPDQGGYDYWKSEIARVGLLPVADYFTVSPEFQQRYGSLTHRQFVSLLYQNVLGRAGDPAGLDHWTWVCSTHSRGYVLMSFSESAEFVNKINRERA